MKKEDDTVRSPLSLFFSLPPILLTVLGLILFNAACGQPTPTPFPTLPERAPATPAPTATATAVPLTTYRNSRGAFSLRLPVSWEVEKQGLTVLGEYYQLGPGPVGPGPASSALFIAPQALTAATAAEMLACGGDCEEAINLEETTVGGEPAARALLNTEGTTLEWFFLDHQEQLIFFTLHDPETLETRADLVDSFRFLEAEAAPTETPPPAQRETAAVTEASESSPWERWQPVTVEDAETSFEIPADWQRLESASGPEWGPVAGSRVRIGFRWEPLAPNQSLRLLLPESGEIEEAQPLTLTLAAELENVFQRAELISMQTERGWEQHALIQVGLRGYDLYTVGPGSGSITKVAPVLRHAADSLALETVRPAFADPVEATVTWFRAALRDRTGRHARAYMSPELRAKVPAGRSPLTLLALEQGLAIYNLTWLSGSQQRAVVEAELILADKSTVHRLLTLVRDPIAGWQVDSIEVKPEGG